MNDEQHRLLEEDDSDWTWDERVAYWAEIQRLRRQLDEQQQQEEESA